MKKLNKFFGLIALVLCFSACEIIAPLVGGIASPVSPVSNPFRELADVQFVGCYGNSGAATVELHFTVTSHSNLITKGNFHNIKFVARGKAYTTYSGPDVEFVRYYPSDVVVRVSQVPDHLVQFDRIELQWYFNASNHSGTKDPLLFHNVPIVWR